MRVVAFHKSDLLPGPDPANHEVTYTDPRNHDELSFLLDLRKLAKVTGEEIPALQQALRDLQSEWLPSPCGTVHVPEAQHQRPPSDVRPLQFLQLASWNVRGKSLFQVADVLSDQAIHFDVIALQEVGGLSQGKLTADGFLDADDPAIQLHDELNDYWLVATDQLSSHLGQAILIDKTFAIGILHTVKRGRFIGTRILHKSGFDFWAFSGHLPHHQQPLAHYTDAIQELRQLLTASRPLPALILADWNATPQQHRLDDQALEIACLTAEEELDILLPDQPTWKHKTYDFIVLTPAFRRCIAPSYLPIGTPQIVPALEQLLPSDHKMVTWETALLPPLAHQQCTSRHRRRPGRWQVDPARLHAGLAKDDHSTCDWKRLCLLARHCQYRPHSRKFKDSPERKRLCRLRNWTAEAAQRASTSRHIIATRRAERAAWLHNLYTAASSGDSSAIAFLRAQHKPTSTWSHLLAHSGSQPAAINKVKDHFQQVFAKTPPNSRAADCTPHLATLQAHMAHTEPQPIHADEVHQALIKLKPGKTSGASGMSWCRTNPPPTPAQHHVPTRLASPWPPPRHCLLDPKGR